MHGRAAVLVMKLLSPRLPCAAGTVVTVEHDQSTDYVLLVTSGDTEQFQSCASQNKYICVSDSGRGDLIREKG